MLPLMTVRKTAGKSQHTFSVADETWERCMARATWERRSVAGVVGEALEEFAGGCTERDLEWYRSSYLPGKQA